MIKTRQLTGKYKCTKTYVHTDSNILIWVSVSIGILTNNNDDDNNDSDDFSIDMEVQKYRLI